jgi:hypothetical protein
MCLEHALYHRIDHGVWGGCSERERRRILKRRRVAALAASPALTVEPGPDGGPDRDQAPNCPAA